MPHNNNRATAHKKYNMKKLLFLLCLFVSAIAAKAQQAVPFPTVYGDTVITSSALDTVTKILPSTAGYSALTIQINAIKVSGTITAKAYLYGTLDGTTYNLTDSAAAFANSASAQSVWFTKTNPAYTKYKIQVRNVGGTTSTESLAIKVWYMLHKFSRD